VKNLNDWAAVHRVYKQTGSKRKTAKLLGMARNTVRRLLEMEEAPTYKRRYYPSKLDAFKERILEWRCEPYLYNGTRIFNELQKLGYKGSIGPVYRYLRHLNEDTDLRISSKATVRHESPPGDQAQFDWSEYQMLIGGQYRTVYCFSMILAASRKKAICFSYREDAEAIYEAIQELFDDLGGVTLELLIDNPKALVLENNPHSEDEIRYNPHALLMAKHLGTELNACPCYWPRKKGKIEKPFQYIEEQFVKGNEFATMEELNARGKDFVNEWCNKKHSTTGRIPNEHYAKDELSTLQPLPKAHWYMQAPQKRKVSPDSFVSINGNKYSVPVKYVGRDVRYRLLYGFRILIYAGATEEVILSVEEAQGKGIIRSDVAHYKAIAPKVSTSIPQIKRDFTEKFTNGAKFLEKAALQFDQPTHHARKIMELGDLYDDEIMDKLIGKAIEMNKLSITLFKSLLRDFNSGKVKFDSSQTTRADITATIDTDKLVRDCSYYEGIAQEGRQ
jgi:transposase